MAIKFNCPHCQKPYSLKDSDAGKRAKCSGCQKVILVPAPVSLPADVEDLVAAALADEQKPAEPPKEIKQMEFACPQCDEKVQVSVEFAGKQAPCPSCKRIIRVPQLIKEEPKDWRKAEQKGPSGVRRDEQPAPEGAWGSATSAGKVSRAALIEANVIVEEREKWTVKQWIVRVGGGVTVLVFVGLGIFWMMQRSTQNQQKQLLASALQLVSSDKASANPLAAAEVHRGAGEYHLRTNTREGLTEAVKQFAESRQLLAAAPASRERDGLLLDLALIQIELGGAKPEVDKGTRLTWDKTVSEIGATLQNLPLQEPQPFVANLPMPGARVAALREVCRQLASNGEAQTAGALAMRSLDQGDPVRPEGLAQVGLDMIQADRPTAEQIAQRLEIGETVAPSQLALYRALNQEEKLTAVQPLIPEGDVAAAFGQALALAYQGKIDEARTRIRGAASPQLHLLALVALAVANPQPESAAEDVKEAADVIERDLKGKGIPPWLLHQLVQVGVRANLSDRLKQLAAALPDASLRGPIQFKLLRARLKATKDKADDGWAEEGVGKQNSVAYGLAREAIARHNARQDSGVAKAVTGWEESVQPFGMIGAVLGMQDAGQ